MEALLSKETSCNSPLSVCGRTDKGAVRSHNEDYFGYFIPSDAHVMDKFGSLFVVSDGVGGNAAGEVASAEAVSVLLQEYYFGEHTEKAPERLKNTFRQTAMHIYDLSSSHHSVNNMRCTLTTLLLKGNRFYIAHVGDSKVYLIRDNKILQLTKDHSLVGKLLRLGLISKEDARTHPNKNILLRAVGEGPILPPDFYSGYVLAGDIFCLVTDGITEHFTEDELRLFLEEKGYNDNGLDQLVAEINRRGGYDNMTILTVKAEEV